MALIEASDYPDIRALIDISLGEAQLPGSVIGLDSFKGRAEREVEAATSATDDHAKLAARLICAALLVRVVPKIESEGLPGASYKREATDWEAHIAQLRADAGTEIALANGETPEETLSETLPTVFTVASAASE